METKNMQQLPQFYLLAGSFVLALRVVVGWTYFSAFWRRLILENKLNPGDAGYIGVKFNHFLPNALGIKPLIEYLVSNPHLLWWAMAIFTMVEAIVGLGVILGFFTRLMGLGVTLLATGILLGSGWLGTTCLDEWQIGILGMATGFTLMLTGGGKYSVDHLWLENTILGKHKIYSWIASGPLPFNGRQLTYTMITGTVIIVFTTLFTNQFFHGGVWGDLHNKSVKPIVDISDVRIADGSLRFTVFRREGVDVYGSFLIGITLTDKTGKTILRYDGEELSKFPLADISNNYIAEVKPGKHSLVIPLGAKAGLQINSPKLRDLKSGEYHLVLTDISGIVWKKDVSYYSE